MPRQLHTMVAEAAALAPALAELTRASSATISVVCSDALQRMDHDQDRVVEARLPELQALAEQVQQSRGSLTQIRNELERFYEKLHTASEHIGKLQDRSNALSEHLSAQETRASTLTDWIEASMVPPSVVRLLRDTNVDQELNAWIRAICRIERTLRALNEYEATQKDAPSAGSARAQARTVAEQCKNLAISKVFPYLTRLFEPIRTSVTTSLPILQSSVLLPHHQPLYQFLALHAPRVAIEVQLSYINAARLYYETAFRRYVRELRKILQRWTEPATLTAWAYKQSSPATAQYEPERQQYAHPITDAAAVLACQSEDVNFKASPEHLFHTLALVFLDTACSEYAFLARFFSGAFDMQEPTYDASAVLSCNMLSLSAEEEQRHESIVTRESWRQVMEPVMAFLAEFYTAVLAMPGAPVQQLLTMANLMHELLQVARSRRCLIPELESVLMRHLLETWPLVAKSLDTEVDTLKTLTIGPRMGPVPRSAGGGGLLERWTGGLMTTDLMRGGQAADALQKILSAYTQFFSQVVSLTSTEQHQGMLLGGLGRIHTELARLVREYATNVYAAHQDGPSPRDMCVSMHAVLSATPDDTHAHEAAKWAELAESFSSETQN